MQWAGATPACGCRPATALQTPSSQPSRGGRPWRGRGPESDSPAKASFYRGTRSRRCRLRPAERDQFTLLAHHALLERVGVLADDDPAAYRRVQRAEERLTRFYRDGPGWSLVRTRAVVRLVREPAPVAAGRGVPRLQEPLDYALFTWVLWYGEGLLLGSTPGAGGGESQFILSDLAEALLAQTAVAPGVTPLDLRDHRQRQSLVRALRALEAWQAIRRLQGAPEEWESSGSGNVLYEFTALAQRMLVRYDAMALAALATGPAHPRREPPAPAAATPLQRAWRALLLGPVFYAADDPEAFAALVEASREVEAAVQKALGFDLDLRRDFALLLRAHDPDAPPAAGALIDVEHPSVRAVYHPILLLAALYRRRVDAGDLRPDAEGVLSLPLAVFESDLWALREAHRDKWGAVLGGAGHRALVRETLEEMRAAGLLRGPDDAERVHLMPALVRVEGRYAAEGEGEPGAGPGPGARRGGGKAGDGPSGPVAVGLF